MPKLFAALAVIALLAATVSVAHAQTPATIPTVSTVAVTSNPGADNTYTTLDVITVTVTFSEAFDGSVRILDNSLPVPLLFGTNPGDRRHARLMANYGDYSDFSFTGTDEGHPSFLRFTYTVQPDDNLDDDDATATLSFGTLPSTVKEGGDHQTDTVTIRDNDDPEVDVELGADAYSANEGGTATVAVTLSADPERTVSIPVTTAKQGGVTARDYTVPSSVTFDSGETEKTITFAATDDDVEDFGESVKLGFGTPLPDRITKSGTQETTINIWQLTTLDCSAALLCAALKLADRTSYDWAW